MHAPIRVLVVDDCELLYPGIQDALSYNTQFELLGLVCDGATALAWLERERPDVALLDCRLPDLCGSEIAVRARERGCTSRLVAYTSYEEYDDVMGMLENGAVGYVSKDEPPENLAQALETVARGETWFSQRIAKKLAEWVQVTSTYTQLSVAEQQVLRQLTDGKSNPEIAAALGIAERTVRYHLRSVSDKLHLERREQLLLWALEHGLGRKRLRESQTPYLPEQE